jgi:tight adherence protein B
MEPTLIILAAAAVAVGIIVFGVVNARSQKSIIEQRLTTFEQQSPTFLDLENLNVEQEDNRPKLRDRLDDALTRRPVGKKWRTALARADLKITVFEYVLLHVVTTIGFMLLAFFILFPGQLVMAVLGAFIGFFTPRLVVARMTGARLIKFETQLPDTLGLWVNALRSGYSVLQSMEAISRDAPEPTATEFKRVVQEVQLGIDMEDAFEHLLQRMESEDLDLVVTAVNIQREVGGNLAEILDVIAHTVRERIKLKGEIRVLTSQGRITGYLISFLPIILALFLNAINPTYVGLLFTNRACGWPMLAIGLTMIGIGMAVIQKIVDIEI